MPQEGDGILDLFLYIHMCYTTHALFCLYKSENLERRMDALCGWRLGVALDIYIS